MSDFITCRNFSKNKNSFEAIGISFADRLKAKTDKNASAPKNLSFSVIVFLD
jgi:hypothetical protein